ncbi:antirestriction protein ArdA [Virgibacillus proomii]|uniref:antirestriction protein ArdA n=1 Tax=Virgibacillus proomii TaxID=84407 RepID=UPI0009862FE5|nr:antirestriction protein ArdA [Virgibacillus proomii]
MDMQVYIANLWKYNEGELVGDWFTTPIDMEEVKERIGLNSEYEEYAIHDFELPFEIHEYTPISEINRLCAMVEELLENQEDIICYADCEDMEDVARYYVEETGMLGEVPTNLQNYIHYQALRRDLEINGNFLVTSHGVFEYLG